MPDEKLLEHTVTLGTSLLVASLYMTKCQMATQACSYADGIGVSLDAHSRFTVAAAQHPALQWGVKRRCPKLACALRARLKWRPLMLGYVMQWQGRVCTRVRGASVERCSF